MVRRKSMEKALFWQEILRRQADSGLSIRKFCASEGFSEPSFYAWRKKFGGMQSSEVRRLKELEQIVSRLERIVARQAVELQASQEIIRGKW